jgi:hypothetical protein
MCAGRFTEDKENKTEIALGCENGSIYLLKDYAIHKHIQVGHTITHLQILGSSGNTTSSHTSNGTLNGNTKYFDSMLNNSQSLQQQIDYLACTGHFNALRIYNKSTVCFVVSWFFKIFIIYFSLTFNMPFLLLICS